MRNKISLLYNFDRRNRTVTVLAQYDLILQSYFNNSLEYNLGQKNSTVTFFLIWLGSTPPCRLRLPFQWHPCVKQKISDHGELRNSLIFTFKFGIMSRKSPSQFWVFRSAADVLCKFL